MGIVYAVGFGPGDARYETLEAREILTHADVIVGYRTYAELLRKQLPNQKYLISGMHEEEARCRQALRLAKEGQQVAVISSGDSAVYGMAGLLYALSEEEEFRGVQVITVPGLSAVLSGSAVLGAPAGHDFCVISLSDLLTPWETIEKRLRTAAEADFVLVLYNPVSRMRMRQFQTACDLLKKLLPGDRICGYVRNIGRDGQKSRIFRLEELERLALPSGAEPAEIDMLSTVFIGNSETRVVETPGGERMVTPRGYENRQG